MTHSIRRVGDFEIVGLYTSAVEKWCRGRESNPHAAFATQDFKPV
jgi:hypothetical protein